MHSTYDWKVVGSNPVESKIQIKTYHRAMMTLTDLTDNNKSFLFLQQEW